MQNVREDNVPNFKNTQQKFSNTAAEAVEETAHDMREAAHKAGRKVRHILHQAGDEIHHATDTVAQQIRTNPVQSSVLALGAGLLLGMLIRR